MSLYCEDGARAEFPAWKPKPKPERGAPWSPPDRSRDRCVLCGMLCWQHSTARTS